MFGKRHLCGSSINQSIEPLHTGKVLSLNKMPRVGKEKEKERVDIHPDTTFCLDLCSPKAIKSKPLITFKITSLGSSRPSSSLHRGSPAFTARFPLAFLQSGQSHYWAGGFASTSPCTWNALCHLSASWAPTDPWDPSSNVTSAGEASLSLPFIGYLPLPYNAHRDSRSHYPTCLS